MRTNEGPHGKWIGGDNMTAHAFFMLVRGFAVEAFRVSRVGAHLFSFIDWRQWPVLAGAIESAGWYLRACLVWDKEHYGMGNGFRQQAEFIFHASKGVADNFVRHDLGTVFRHRRHREDSHPTMKPEKVVTTILSAVPAGVVLDPFAGSGTTIVAAMAVGCEGLGFEIDRNHVELANDRILGAERGLSFEELRAGQKTLFEEEA